MASDCQTCGGQGDIMCPGYAGRGCGPGEDAFGATCAICNGAARVGCPDCEGLPSGPTWSEALAVIRRHDPAAADWLERRRYLLYSRAWAVAFRTGGAYSDANRRISQSTALARLESEALDLFEQLREKGGATDEE